MKQGANNKSRKNEKKRSQEDSFHFHMGFSKAQGLKALSCSFVFGGLFGVVGFCSLLYLTGWCTSSILLGGKGKGYPFQLRKSRPCPFWSTTAARESICSWRVSVVWTTCWRSRVNREENWWYKVREAASPDVWVATPVGIPAQAKRGKTWTACYVWQLLSPGLGSVEALLHVSPLI